jgi:hypothetical protein
MQVGSMVKVADVGIKAGIFQGQAQQKSWIFSPLQFADSDSWLLFPHPATPKLDSAHLR